MNNFSFTLHKTQGKSRAGEFTTPHGVVETPIFMPVGTRATVKSLDSQDLEELEAQIILANTYHLYLKPGAELIDQLGDVHQFMNWKRPVLTDSGGFQVFSLGNKTRIEQSGVSFFSHYDGSEHFFTPEKSIEIQRQLGADIIMTFDECTPDQANSAYTREALDRTHRWAKQCFDYWQKQQHLSTHGHYQALFGIIQGAMHQSLREESAEFITNLDFDGIAVGGETIGYNMPGSAEVMSWIENSLPDDKPRYAMGMGREPQDIIAGVQMGFDMFDCVGPTRLARNGALFVGHLETIKAKNGKKEFVYQSDFPRGRLNIRRQEFKNDSSVIQEDCDCTTCQHGYSRAYLHHLFKSKELSYYRLATIHNVRAMIRTARQLRQEILR